MPRRFCRQPQHDPRAAAFLAGNLDAAAVLLEIRRLKPDAKVMMMTGFSVEELPQQAAGGGAFGVLQKPFAPAVLLAAIEAMMTKAR